MIVLCNSNFLNQKKLINMLIFTIIGKMILWNGLRRFFDLDMIVTPPDGQWHPLDTCTPECFFDVGKLPDALYVVTGNLIDGSDAGILTDKIP